VVPDQPQLNQEEMMILRSRILAGVLVAATLIGTSAGVASATSHPSRATTGTEHFWVSNWSPKTGKPTSFIGNGLFTDAGSLSGGKVTLSKGSFVADRSNLKTTFKFDSKTCYLVGTFSGTISLHGGTGAYKGISGTLSAGGTVVSVVPRLKNGTCNGSAVPIATIGVVAGSGKVTL
jgi:hypothetical protein